MDVSVLLASLDLCVSMTLMTALGHPALTTQPVWTRWRLMTVSVCQTGRVPSQIMKPSRRPWSTGGL